MEHECTRPCKAVSGNLRSPETTTPPPVVQLAGARESSVDQISLCDVTMRETRP